jgi:hypothetical protein
MLEGSWRS